MKIFANEGKVVRWGVRGTPLRELIALSSNLVPRFPQKRGVKKTDEATQRRKSEPVCVSAAVFSCPS